MFCGRREHDDLGLYLAVVIEVAAVVKALEGLVFAVALEGRVIIEGHTLFLLHLLWESGIYDGWE